VISLRPCSRRGNTLFLMLITAAMLTLLLSGLLYQVASLVRSAELAAVRTQCRALAEGGLEVARAQVMAAAQPVESLDLEISAPSGQCRVRVEPTRRPDTYEVFVTARQVYRSNQLASYEIQANLNTGRDKSVYQRVTCRFVPLPATQSAQGL